MSPESTRSMGAESKYLGTPRQQVQVTGHADRLARIVSYVLNPLLLFAASFFLPYLIEPVAQNLLYAAIHLGSLGLMFSIYLSILRWRGQTLDFELKDRRDRTTPLGLTIAALVVLGVFMSLQAYSGLLIYINSAAVLMFLVFWFITRYWKVSLHSLTISFLLAALFLIANLDGRFGALLLLIPLVVWARVRLRYHDLHQSLVGIMLGVSAILLYRWLVATNPLSLAF